MHNIEKHIEAIFEKMGNHTQITRADGSLEFTHAVIQPLRYKNKLYVELQPSKLGKFDDGCCLYLGPSSHPIHADEIINVSDKSYVVQRSESIFLFSKPIYIWAIIRPSSERQDI